MTVNRSYTHTTGLTREEIIAMVSTELDHAYKKHGREQWGRHEFYAILKEEVDELWDAIKTDKATFAVLEEAIDTIAMCFRYLETGDRYRGASETFGATQPKGNKTV